MTDHKDLIERLLLRAAPLNDPDLNDEAALAALVAENAKLRAELDYDVAGLLAELDAAKVALDFAAGAIGDAIYTEDGLDGDAGQRVLHIITEARERGTFDKEAFGALDEFCPFSRAEKAEAERDAAVAEALPIVREYARKSPLHHFNGAWQDPNLAHAWLEKYDAARAALAQPAEPDAYPALQALTEAVLTQADADYMRRQLDEAVRIMATRGWSPPVPYHDWLTFGRAVERATRNKA